MRRRYQRHALPSTVRRQGLLSAALAVLAGLCLTWIAHEATAGWESAAAAAGAGADGPRIPAGGVALIGLALTAVSGLFAWRFALATAARVARLAAEVVGRVETEDALAVANRTLADAVADREALVVQKDVLLREMNHRIKNNLQLMNALLMLHRGRVQDPAARGAFDDVMSRMDAVSQIHERLQPSGDRLAVRMDHYLAGIAQTLAVALGMEDASALAVSAEPVELPPEQAVPIALVVNELVTNALKYGTADRVPPRADISLARDGGDIVLEVRDYGPGLPKTDGARPAAGDGRRRGLGTVLVGLLADQLDGTLRTEDAVPGCRAVLRFPAPDPAQVDGRTSRSAADDGAGPPSGWHDSPSQQSASTRPAGQPQARWPAT
jgi:two-component sensor histidine kinase